MLVARVGFMRSDVPAVKSGVRSRESRFIRAWHALKSLAVIQKGLRIFY
jgi:hypothetical protein